MKEFEKYPRMVRFYLREGQKFMDSHPESYVHGLYGDVYGWFVCDVMCKDLDEFRAKYAGRDCRNVIEERFGVDLSGLWVFLAYDAHEYEHLVRDFFYWRKTQKEWEEIKRTDFLGSGTQLLKNQTAISCKQFLEDYFKIKFKD